MDETVLQNVQNQIGYEFHNLDLLRQAFVRRSYSKENGGEDNEVLEFIGDKVLDFVVVKLLTEKYGYYLQDCEDYDPQEENNEFACEYQENKLTEIKKRLVCKETLANQITHLGFAKHLILGSGDEKNHVEKQPSVKEDLFEAILGAVALDSGWNIEEMQNVVEIMLNPEQYLDRDDDNYVQMLQEWSIRRSEILPIYKFGDTRKVPYPVGIWGIVGYQFRDIYDQKKAGQYNRYPVCCHMSIDLENKNSQGFLGLGKSKSDARKDACEQAYKYLDEHNLLFTIRDEIDNPNESQAINQLETLARRGYFSIPTYEFEQKYDEDGNPIWYSECHILEYENYYWAEASSKKEAKKSAAYEMLLMVLE